MDIFRNSLVGGLLHGFLRPECPVKKALLLLLGGGRGIRGDTILRKCEVAGKADAKHSLLCASNVRIRGIPDFRKLLTARVHNITNATNLSTPFHSGLRSIGVVFEGCVEG